MPRAEFSFTATTRELVPAVRSVLPFAGTDDTLPALVAVHVHLGADGAVTLTTTDRYMLGVRTFKADAHDGHGELVIPAGTAKTLAAIKDRTGLGPVTITNTQAGYDITYPDGTRTGYPRADGPGWGEFPSRAVETIGRNWEPAAVAGPVKFNPAFLARFAKAADSKSDAVTITPGKDGRPARFAIGDGVTGYICPIR